MGKLPTVDLSSVGDLLNNQRLTWFLIGNLIGLGGLLLVVFASDAARHPASEPVARHSLSRQSSQQSELTTGKASAVDQKTGTVVKNPDLGGSINSSSARTAPVQGEKPAANSGKDKNLPVASLKTQAQSEGELPPPKN